jgi:hypothetical protein
MVSTAQEREKSPPPPAAPPSVYRDRESAPATAKSVAPSQNRVKSPAPVASVSPAQDREKSPPPARSISSSPDRIKPSMQSSAPSSSQASKNMPSVKNPEETAASRNAVTAPARQKAESTELSEEECLNRITGLIRENKIETAYSEFKRNEKRLKKFMAKNEFKQYKEMIENSYKARNADR